MKPLLDYLPQWSPGGRWLFGIPNWEGDNDQVRFWEVTLPSHSYKLQSHANTLHFSPDGNLLAVNGDVWKVQTSKDQAFLSPPHKSSGADYAFVSAKGQVWYAFLPTEVVDRYDPQQRKSSLQMIDAQIKLVQDYPEKRTILLPRPAKHGPNRTGDGWIHRVPADIVRFGFSPSGSRFCVMYYIDYLFNAYNENNLMRGMEQYDMDTSKHPYKTFSHFPMPSAGTDVQTEVWSLENKDPKRLCKLESETWTFPMMKPFGVTSRWLLGMQRSDRGQEHSPSISSGFSKSCFFSKDSVLFTNNESAVVVQGEGLYNWKSEGSIPILDINSQQRQEVVLTDEVLWPPYPIICKLLTPRMDRRLVAGKGGTVFAAWQVGEQEDQDRRPQWKETQQTKKGGLLILEGGNSPVYKLALSNDEKFLVSVSQDLTLRLWDLTTGKEVLKCQPHEAEVTALAFSPDGKTLVTAGADNILKVWNLEYIRQELNALGLGW